MRNSSSSSPVGVISRALFHCQPCAPFYFLCARDGGVTNIIARRTSPIGITPSFEPFCFLANKENASRISFSSAGVTLCSFASLDWRGLGAGASAAGSLRLGGFDNMTISLGALRLWRGGEIYHLEKLDAPEERLLRENVDAPGVFG